MKENGSKDNASPSVKRSIGKSGPGVAANSCVYKRRITPRLPPQNIDKNLGAYQNRDIIEVVKHNRFISVISIVGLAALILMLNLTSPTEIGPFGVLLFFTTVYIVSFGIVTLIFQSFMRLAFKKEVFRGKDYLYSAVLAFGPIMFLMVRSFGAINLWTTALICIFIFLAEFLVAKRV